MTWTFDNFPLEMQALTPALREKAIEIANKLKAEGKLPATTIIAEAIKQAEEWFIDLEG